jgi:hypothetical protein
VAESSRPEGAHPTPKTSRSSPSSLRGSVAPSLPNQLSLFTEFLPHPAIDKLKEIKLEALTPLEAFDALRKLKALTDPQKSSSD